jgi:hypothetical protein
LTASKNGLLQGRKHNIKEAEDNMKLGTGMVKRMRKIKEMRRKIEKWERKTERMTEGMRGGMTGTER